MIEVNQLKKVMNNKLILENINFKLKKGSVVGLLGRNGVGKTTLLRTIVGILLPEEGEVFIDGVNSLTNPQIKENLIFVSDTQDFISQYKTSEIIDFYLTIYPEFDSTYCKALMNQYHLPQAHIKTYSKGMKALLAIILAFCSNAMCIILDEPINGIDSIIKRQVLQFIIKEVSEKETTVIISTHQLDELEKIADTILLLENKTINKAIDLEEIKQSFTKIQVAFEEAMPSQLKDLNNVKLLSQIGKLSTVLIEGNVEKTLNQFQKEKPILLEEIPMSLEDIFIASFGGNTYVS